MKLSDEKSNELYSLLSQKPWPNGYWECPHCHNGARFGSGDIRWIVDSEFDSPFTTSVATLYCKRCCRPSVYELTTEAYTDEEQHILNITSASCLYPPSGYIQDFPEYVPEPIRKDYEEAALIAELSPKASAALVRRCVQGLIIDKWPETKKFDRLYYQINFLKPPSISAQEQKTLHAIRKIGNVGAHMKDPGVIAEQDSPINPDDAANLIKLLEFLIKAWYIDVHETDSLMKSMIERGEEIAAIHNIKVNGYSVDG